MSILLKRELAHLVVGWDVSILGTDINQSSLAQAREGKFEEWAFRSTQEDIKRECFLKEGNSWRIAPEYQKGVSFKYHNLAEHSYPSPSGNPLGFDLIVCRNVLIYFRTGVMEETILQFHDCLRPGGWLLVGPAEPNMTSFTLFRAVNAPGVTLYQRAELEAAKAVETIFPASLPYLPVASGLTRQEPAALELAQPTLADVRRQSDRGEWENSTRTCQQLLEIDNLNSTAHFYHALILEHLNRYGEAEQSLRRAIYLDRQFILAHYHLGLLLLHQGDLRRAARSVENTLELLSHQCDNNVLDDAGGITVRQLKQSAKMHFKILREWE